MEIQDILILIGIIIYSIVVLGVIILGIFHVVLKRKCKNTPKPNKKIGRKKSLNQEILNGSNSFHVDEKDFKYFKDGTDKKHNE